MSPPKPLTTITIAIDAPKANSNVPGGGSFTTYGRSSPTTGLNYSAQVVDGSNSYTGTAVAPRPTYQWEFTFTGVPTGHEVFLTVTGDDGKGDTGSKTIGITCTNP
jgi:hypothetical protein